MEVSSRTLQWHRLEAANLTPALIAALGGAWLAPSQLEAQVELVAAFARAFLGAMVSFCCDGFGPADLVLTKFYEGSPLPLDPQLAILCERLRPLFTDLIQLDLARADFTGAPLEARVVALIAVAAPLPVGPFALAGLSRPKPGMSHNGDGFWTFRHNQQLLACVIDGLGHGPSAQLARDRALEVLPASHELGLERMFEKVHHALNETRGAAMTATRIDSQSGTFTSAGIGNVELLLAPKSSNFIPMPGVVGMPPWRGTKVSERAWSCGHMLALHSDGIRSGWSIEALARSKLPLSFLVLLIVFDCARADDDATLLLVRGNSHE